MSNVVKLLATVLVLAAILSYSISTSERSTPEESRCEGARLAYEISGDPGLLRNIAAYC